MAGTRVRLESPLRFHSINPDGKPGVEAVIRQNDALTISEGAVHGSVGDSQATLVRLIKEDEEIGRGPVADDGSFVISPDKSAFEGDCLRIEWRIGRGMGLNFARSHMPGACYDRASDPDRGSRSI